MKSKKSPNYYNSTSWHWPLVVTPSTYWALDNHFSMSFLFTESILILLQFAITNHGLLIGSLLIFFFSVWTTFFRCQYLCWYATGGLLPSQFEIHKSNGPLTVTKGCSPIDRCKHKGLISLIRKRTQQYQRFISIIDRYIQICQICKKLRIDIDVITNGNSSLQLKMIVFSSNASGSRHSSSSTCSRESLKSSSYKSHSSHHILDPLLSKI